MCEKSGYTGEMVSLVGIDFEMANATHGSICAYGLAFEAGFTESSSVRLHPTLGGVQERERWHNISQESTDAGMGFDVLYERLELLPRDTILVAHDAKIDRRELTSACEMWDLEPLEFTWLDSLSVARREFGKQGKHGIKYMAERLEMSVTEHDPADDARVALAIVQTYGIKGIRILD